jgi:cell division protein FtsQ
MWDDPRQLNAIAAGVALIAALALIAGGLGWLFRQPVFEFREVVLMTPPARASAPHLEAVIRDELAGTFFTMNLDRAQSALMQVPWVRHVSLRRQWPQRLEVTIEEHEPLARWNGDALVNASGEVFSADYDGDLPQFEGADARAAEVTARYREWSSALDPLSLVVQQIRISARGGWRLRVTGPSGPLDIELGRNEPGERLVRFIAVYGRTIGTLARAGTRIDRVDLRYRNGFAARVPEFHERPAKKARAA